MYLIHVDGQPRPCLYPTIALAAKARTAIASEVVPVPTHSYAPGDGQLTTYGAQHRIDICRADKAPLSDEDIDAVVAELSKRR